MSCLTISAVQHLLARSCWSDDCCVAAQRKLDRLIERGYCHKKDIDSATMDALEGELKLELQVHSLVPSAAVPSAADFFWPQLAILLLHVTRLRSPDQETACSTNSSPGCGVLRLQLNQAADDPGSDMTTALVSDTAKVAQMSKTLDFSTSLGPLTRCLSRL